MPKIDRTTSKAVFKRRDSLQKSIPVKNIHDNGLFEFAGEWSICLEFSDVNYNATSAENKASIVLGFEQILKSQSDDINLKLVVMQRVLHEKTLENDLYLPLKEDDFNEYRNEVNAINRSRAVRGTNKIVRDRFFTVSGAKKSKQEAESWLNRIEAGVTNDLSEIGAACHRQSTEERLRSLHRFFRPGEAERFTLDWKGLGGKGSTVRDYICPDRFDIDDTYVRINEKYARALVVRDLPSWISDELIPKILDLPKEIILSLDTVSVSKDEGIRRIQRVKDKVESDISKRARKSMKDGNISFEIPQHLKEMRESCDLWFDRLNNHDERVTMYQMVIVHVADTLQELNEDTDTIKTAAAGKSCQIGVLTNRQERGINTALPYGLRYIDALQAVNSAATGVLIPFTTKEIRDPGGICYGVNAISGNIITINRASYINPHAFIIGTSGGGKSFFVKMEAAQAFLITDDDLLFIDPSGEYMELARLFGALPIRIFAGSAHHINVMDMAEGYNSEDSSIELKSEFVLSLLEIAVGKENLGARERSIVDRCTRRILSGQGCGKGKTKEDPVTLQTLYDELMQQDDPLARDVATSLEMFTEGSLNAFAQRTNVDLDNRVTCYDVSSLGSSLKGLGMLCVMDAIDRRVMYNFKRGKRTRIYCDEIWSLFRYPRTADYLDEWWRRIRKYGGIMTGITQNISEVFANEKASMMISNSEFIFMLKQAPEDVERIVEKMHISPEQENMLRKADKGRGLLSAGGTIVPFDGWFDKNIAPRIYHAVSTDPTKNKKENEDEGAEVSV
ncbi:MAG TPA: hypothetical protein DEB31_11345 [Clostridiales bacterium]|nr:hypothetical protein [Clostridiales bacterium]